MLKKYLAFMIIAAMLLVPVAVFAGDAKAESSEDKKTQAVSNEEEADQKADDAEKDPDNKDDDAEKKTDQEDSETSEDGSAEGNASVNNGSIDANNGIIDVNNGVIEVNNGTIAVNNGTILNNNGTVETNNGDIETNNGTINVSNGAVTNNNGEISANNGSLNLEENTETDSEPAADMDSDEKTEVEDTAAGSEITEYEVIEGDQQTWKGSDDIQFTAEAPWKHLTGLYYGTKDESEPQELGEEDYTAEKDGDTTIITLKEDFLGTLKAGDYVFSAMYEDGEATVELAVAPLDESPDMGDGSVLPWALCGLMFLSVGAAVKLLRKTA